MEMHDCESWGLSWTGLDSTSSSSGTGLWSCQPHERDGEAAKIMESKGTLTLAGPTPLWAWLERDVHTALTLTGDKTLGEPTTVLFPTG